MERADSEAVITFFSPESFAAGAPVSLGDEAAHHARVRRLEVGVRVRLSDGAGTLAEGRLVRLVKNHLVVDVDAVTTNDPLPAVHLLVPIADRERMLWLAEKAVELGATSWRPVMWKRSKSVAGRGEGSSFQQKIRARMLAALEQSGSPWLPTVFPDARPEHALAATPAGTRLLLDREGEPILNRSCQAPAAIAVGPEGGLDAAERAMFVGGGFLLTSLGGHTLRFETAGLAALSVARAALATTRAGVGG